MFACSSQIISRKDVQRKFLMFAEFSGRHVVLASENLCLKFNTLSLGKCTDLKLGEVSWSPMTPWRLFDLSFNCVTTKNRLDVEKDWWWQHFRANFLCKCLWHIDHSGDRHLWKGEREILHEYSMSQRERRRKKPCEYQKVKRFHVLWMSSSHTSDIRGSKRFNGKEPF